MKKPLAIFLLIVVVLIAAASWFSIWAIPIALGPPGPCDVPLGEEKLDTYLLAAVQRDAARWRKNVPEKYPEIASVEILSYELEWFREKSLLENFTYKSTALDGRIATSTGVVSCHEIVPRTNLLQFN